MSPAMRAVGYRENLDVEDPASLVDVTMPVPEPGAHDLLVRVRAVSVNPVDTKIRRGSPVAGADARILGFDAAGTVEAIGAELTRFGVGDDIYYAGVTNRQGSNAEFQLVDEHIVARKPATLNFARAAALPLTTITAWQGLFDHLALTPRSAVGRRLRADGRLVLVHSGRVAMCGAHASFRARAITSRPRLPRSGGVAS